MNNNDEVLIERLAFKTGISIEQAGRAFEALGDAAQKAGEEMLKTPGYAPAKPPTPRQLMRKARRDGLDTRAAAASNAHTGQAATPAPSAREWSAINRAERSQAEARNARYKSRVLGEFRE